MDITPIKTNADYRAALAGIEALMNAEPDTPDGDRLDVVATLVEAYETRHFPIAAPDPIDAIKFRMDQMGLTRKDLEPLLGTRGRVSEVLSGRRRLSLSMIRQLIIDLDNPDTTLWRFVPNIELEEIKPKPFPPRNAAARGALSRLVPDTWRQSKEPLTSHDVA